GRRASLEVGRGARSHARPPDELADGATRGEGAPRPRGLPEAPLPEERASPLPRARLSSGGGTAPRGEGEGREAARRGAVVLLPGVQLRARGCGAEGREEGQGPGEEARAHAARRLGRDRREGQGAERPRRRGAREGARRRRELVPGLPARG